MEIFHKKFRQEPDYKYGKFDDNHDDNPIKISRKFYIPCKSYNLTYAFVFTEEEVLNGIHGNIDIEQELMVIWQRCPIFEYKIIKKKFCKKSMGIIYLVKVTKCEADC